MKILNERPPIQIWEEAHLRFEIDDDLTVYTYGDVLYNPAGIEISDDLLVHEEVHRRQQALTKGGASEWWIEYFRNSKFRAEQEAQAYGAQYKFYCSKVKDRNDQFRFLDILANLLSSGMYRTNLSKSECLSRIKQSPTPLGPSLNSRGRGFGHTLAVGERGDKPY